MQAAGMNAAGKSAEGKIAAAIINKQSLTLPQQAIDVDVTPKTAKVSRVKATPEKVEAKWTAVEKRERNKYHFFQLRRGNTTGGQVSITGGVDFDTARAVSTFMSALLNYGWPIACTKEAKTKLLNKKPIVAFGGTFTIERVLAEAGASESAD